MKSVLKLLCLSVLMIASAGASENDFIPDQYIVILAGNADPLVVAQDRGIVPIYFYNSAFTGFAGRISTLEKDNLTKDPRVVLIERDKIVRKTELEPVANWGIDRIDQRSLPLDGLYNYVSTGKGVTAYVIDSGIRYDHQEFNGRATFAYDALGGDGSDCSGHGTHVAGTIGGTNNGVAKEVSLKSLKVLNCRGNGSLSGIIAAIDWVIANATLPAVTNISIGSRGRSFAWEMAVNKLIARGVATTVAAGNGGRDACNYSPAGVADVITIGATGINDAKTSWSNYGNCVDFFAPGNNVVSSYNTSATDTRSLSGTSMASPHVAGAAALYLQTHPGASHLQVRDALLAFSTKGKVSNTSFPNNHLLYLFETVDNSGDYISPSSTITAPLNDSSFPRGSVITLRADGSDNMSLGTIKFYVNGGLVCTDGSSPYTCDWRVPSRYSSSYYIQVRATDASGNTGSSSYVLINSF